MDIDMPVMDGISATVKIRDIERKQKLQRTFIVALTGVTSKEGRSRCLASGMDRYLSKPIRMKDLREVVEEVKGSGE